MTHDEKIVGGFKELTGRCIRSDGKWLSLICVKLAYLPPDQVKEFGIQEVERKELIEQGERMGGLVEIAKKAREAREERDHCLSELAAYMDDIDFEIEEFETELPEDQLSWLRRMHRVIKGHLRGVEI